MNNIQLKSKRLLSQELLKYRLLFCAKQLRQKGIAHNCAGPVAADGGYAARISI